jgi:hypothetical protein
LQAYIKDDYFSWVMKEDGSYEKQTLDLAVNRSQIDLIKNKKNIDFYNISKNT